MQNNNKQTAKQNQLLNTLSTEIVDHLAPLALVKASSKDAAYIEFKNILESYLENKLNKEVSTSILDKDKELKKLLEEIDVEIRRTKISSNLAVFSTVLAMLSAASLFSGLAIFTFAGFAVFSSFVGWILKIFSDLKSKKEARQFSEELLSHLSSK